MPFFEYIRINIILKYLCLALIILFSSNLMGKKPMAVFRLQTLPDHSWTLYLYKDRTYRYEHWSCWSNTTTKDYGIFKLENDLITLISSLSDSTLYYLNKGYSLKKMGPQQIPESKTLSDIIVSYKKSIFYRRHFVLTLKE
jgi:hypothetical protein